MPIFWFVNLHTGHLLGRVFIGSFKLRLANEQWEYQRKPLSQVAKSFFGSATIPPSCWYYFYKARLHDTTCRIRNVEILWRNKYSPTPTPVITFQIPLWILCRFVMSLLVMTLVGLQLPHKGERLMSFL